MQNGRRIFSQVRTFGAVILLFTAPIVSTAQQLRMLSGHVPAVATNLNVVGRLLATNHLRLTVGLPLQNKQSLPVLLERIYGSTSPDYHRYLSPEQFAEQFCPSSSDYQMVADFFKSNGFKITGTHSNRMLVDVEAPVDAVEKVFHIAMNVYFHPHEKRTFFAPDREPCVEKQLPILSISGLTDYVIPHPVHLKTSPASSFGIYGSGSAPGGYFWGYDFRNAYANGVSLDGSGQMLGLFELDGYWTNDIVHYEQQTGLPAVPLENVYVDGFNGTPGNGGAGSPEVPLDIDMAIAMAPGLSKLIVYEGPNLNNISTPNDILNQMAVENRAKQLSCSWGFAMDATTEQIFQEFAAQGQSFFQASSDSGAYAGPIPSPCDDPYVTSVGGTSLTTVDGGGAWVSEVVWSGSGGGSSFNYQIPIWQQGINMSTNQGSTTMRNMPDVAMLAEKIWLYWANGAGQSISGGTSASAPLWAGFAALVNQQAMINAEPPIGFINPAVYAIGKGTNFNTCFHDITVGNDTNSSSPTKYFAVAGYDLCTGWGTPNGSNLINVLAPFNPLRITPIGGTASSGQIGGAFSAGSFALTNAGAVSLNWSVMNPPAWLNVIPAGGTILPGQTFNLSLNPNAAANCLTAGQYPVDLWFTNSSLGTGQLRQFSLTVNPLVQNGGFETGDFTGWTSSGANNTSAVAYTNSNFPQGVHSGAWGAGLINSGLPLGYLSQTISTIPGQQYVLSFWLDSSANPTSPHKTTPNQFLVSWNGTTLFNQTNIGVIGWTNMQFVVAAAGTSSALQFGFRDDPWALGLDDITLQPIVAPSYQGFSKSSNALKFTWAAVAGLKYQMQYKTNLMQTNWVSVGTPAIATNTFLTTTNSVPADPQRFYRIVWVP